MALLSVLAARKSAIVKFIRDTSPSVQPAALPTSQIPFTDSDWHLASQTREAYDRLEHIKRWAVTVTPSDHCARRYYMVGTLPGVSNRARHIFPDQICLVLIEPASMQDGGETYDGRLNLSTKPLPTEL